MGETMAAPGAARRDLGMSVLCFVLFLTFLDNTIISATLSSVQSDLHAGVTALQWVVSGYALPFASLMLMCGTLGDLFGRKRLMLIGIVVFCAGSVVAATSTGIDQLIAGRVVMGIGAAASEPATLSMIRQVYPDRRDRAEALGIWAAISGLALALGPGIGGILVGVWSWRGVFWFNLAFGVLAFIGAKAVLPETSDPVRARLDLTGFVLGALSIGTATFATIDGETAGYRAWWIIVLYAAAVVSAVAFVLVELRADNPVLNVRYFRRAPFAGATIVAFTTYFGIFSIFFFVALYLEVVGSVSGYQLALDFLPLAVCMVLAAVLTGRWVGRVGPKIPMATGCVLAGLGILLTDMAITPTAGIGAIGWTLGIAGAGFGMAIVPVTSSALSTVPGEHSGMAASATNTSRELGAVAGVAILGSIVNRQLTVNLIQRLTAIGIPHAFQSTVITAVTTGSISSEASSVKGDASIAVIVKKVTTAAYAAFGHGLDLCLLAAASLMFLSAVIALMTGISARTGSHRWRHRPAAGPATAPPAGA